MFQFRPFPSYTYFIQCTMPEYCSGGFPHSEIHGFSGYLLLPVAYRSLSRPSSAPDAKAFPLRSFQLDRRRRNSLPSVSASQRILLIRRVPPTWFRDRLVLCLNYAGNFTGFLSRNCNCYPSIYDVPQLKLFDSFRTIVRKTSLLPCFSLLFCIVQFSRYKSPALSQIETFSCS